MLPIVLISHSVLQRIKTIVKRGATGRGLKMVRAFTNCGGGAFAEFDVKFKFAKIQNSNLWGGGGGGGGSQNLMLSSNLLKSKIPICEGGELVRRGGVVVGVWGGLWNLMLSSNLLKSKIPISGGVGGWGGFAEFDVEFKFAKIQNSHLWGGGGGGGGGTNFQLLMLSPNLLKKK